MSREMKHSGVQWIGDIPKDWDIDTIGNLYTLRNEKVSDKDYPPLSVSKMGVVPQLETAAKTDDGDNRKLVKVGDFAINSRSDRRGSCGISAYDGSVSLINTVITPREQMNPRFYSWLFHSELFADEFYKWGHGIVDDLWTTRWQEMKRISIVAPSLEEQQKIASFLDRKCCEIDEMIALQEKIVEELKAYKQSVITEAVTKGLNPDVPMKDSGIEWIGKIPEHWKVCKIKNSLEINPPQCHKLEEDTEVSYMPMECLRNGIIEKRVALFGSLPSLTEFSDGDIVMAKVTPCFENGNIAVATDLTNGVGFGSSEVFVFRCHANTLSNYAFYYLQSPYVKARGVSSMTGTGGLKRINPHYFCDSLMLLPNLAEQQEIAEHLDKRCTEIDNLISIKLSKIDSLNEYKKSIIYEYVTGKKEVTE